MVDVCDVLYALNPRHSLLIELTREGYELLGSADERSDLGFQRLHVGLCALKTCQASRRALAHG